MGSALTLWKKPDNIYVTRDENPRKGTVVVRAPMRIKGAAYVSEDAALRDFKNRIANIGANAGLELSKTRYFTGSNGRRHECFYFTGRPALIYHEYTTNDSRESEDSKRMMEATCKQVRANIHTVNQAMIRREMTHTTIVMLFIAGMISLAAYYAFF